ncbi:MAG: peptidylprolyl isomerase [Oscillospiraceae bacterium]|nr:peptidylprolyl isomerase [Oscillospiraceae bacterium]
MKKILAAVCAAMTLSLAGCSFTPTYNVMNEYDFTQMELVQLEPPQDGDTIAIFDTSLGEIRTVLYEEYAPNTVAAFIEKANSGYYNGLTVSGIMDSMYFLSGYTIDEDGNYSARESDDELIDNECNVNLWPFKGALLTFSEKPGYSDARWFICNEEPITEEDITNLKDSASKREDEAERENLTNLFDKFYEIGGCFGVSGTYTVFGQTYSGIEVVEDICAIPTDENGIPKEEVIIRSVTISEYSSETAE